MRILCMLGTDPGWAALRYLAERARWTAQPLRDGTAYQGKVLNFEIVLAAGTKETRGTLRGPRVLVHLPDPRARELAAIANQHLARPGA